MNIFPDETLTRLSNGYTGDCPQATDPIPVVLPDCPSLESPAASSSPLQQLLFEPTVHPASFVAKHLTKTPSRVPGKWKRHDNRRHQHDQASTDTSCLGLPTPKADATGGEQFGSAHDKLPWNHVVRRYGIADSVASDTYLLKVPRRSGVGVASGAASERSATVALLDLSAQKRKSPENLLEVSPKKQRISWPTAAPNDVSHVVYRGASSGANKSLVASVSRVPSTSAVSLCDGRRTARLRSDLHTAPLSKTLADNYGSKSTRRPHISSWSADDVFAFVLSTPHASIYAKVRYPPMLSGYVLFKYRCRHTTAVGWIFPIIYTTKIDGVFCPPNISETVAVRTVKLAHRPRISSTTITLISKPILLSIS